MPSSDAESVSQDPSDVRAGDVNAGDPAGEAPVDSRRNASGSEQRDEAVDRFIAFWGEMASTWGINRTMAQIHALLYCEEDPLNTDDIMERLDISRGNANMNLRSLTDWNLVTKTHLPGSRKDFYVAEKDVWQITAQIIRERERREIQPVKAELKSCAELVASEDAEDRPEADRTLHRRLQNLIDLMDVFEGFSEALLPLVRKQNAPMIKQLIQTAQLLAERED